LELNDAWEYRRLGEGYAQLNDNLLRRLAARGYIHSDSDIREAAHDLLEEVEQTL
jgi:hypothetical protein